MNRTSSTIKRSILITSAVALLSATVAILISTGSVLKAAKGNRYDALIRNSVEWSAINTMKEADRQLKLGDKGKAMVLYMSVAEQLATDDSEQAIEMRTRACIRQGEIHMEEGNCGAALKAYMKGLEISETSDREPHIAVIYKNMAQVYNLFRDYDKKRSLEQTGLEKARAQHDTTTMITLLNNLSRGYVASKNPKMARRYYSMLDTIARHGSPEEKYQKDYTQAMVVRCEGRIEEALRRFHELASRADNEISDPRYKCSIYNEIYWIYSEMPAMHDSAGYYLNKCIRLVKDNRLSLMFMDEIKELSQYYQRMGDHGRAMKWKLEYLELADSAYISNVRQIDGVRNRQFLYEMDKAESQINALWQEKRRHNEIIARQRWIIAGTVLGVIAAIIIIRYIISQNRRLTESYRSIYSLNQTLMNNHRVETAARQALEDENERLRRDLAEAVETHAANSDDRSRNDRDTPAKEKYSTSNLAGEQERILTQRILKVMEGDDVCYCDSDFSLGVLAEKVGSNVKYVSQIINDSFGKSFSNYVNEYRIREACARLSGKEPYGNYSVKGIGESVGFRSHSTFVGVFRKTTGMTPSIYRKIAMSDHPETQQYTNRRGMDS